MTEKPDCYDYVRNYYKVPAYIGARVKAYGRQGVIVRHRSPGQYIYIHLDGDTRPKGPYHPTDGIEYLPLAEDSSR